MQFIDWSFNEYYFSKVCTLLFQIALCSWANLDFRSEGAIKEIDRRAPSELTNSHFERFALERVKEKKVDQINE